MINGGRSVRETVRLIGKSAEYNSRFVQSVGAHNASVLMYRHFLAREPENPLVVDHWATIISQDWTSAIDGFVDGQEYQNRFGDDAVPHP